MSAPGEGWPCRGRHRERPGRVPRARDRRGRAVSEVALWRRLLAECLGSAFLAAVVAGSGIAAQHLSPGETGLELLENAAATAAGLFAIILMFGPVSGAHFNPVVSFADAAPGGLRRREAAAYLPAQVAGCTGGAVLANLMFAQAAVSISAKHRATPAHFLSEVIATPGLILVIFALARSGRSRAAPPRSAHISGRRTFSRPRPASPTRPSPPAGCSRTLSPALPRPQHRRSSPPRSSAARSPSWSSRCCIPTSPLLRQPASSSLTTPAARACPRRPAQRTRDLPLTGPLLMEATYPRAGLLIIAASVTGQPNGRSDAPAPRAGRACRSTAMWAQHRNQLPDLEPPAGTELAACSPRMNRPIALAAPIAPPPRALSTGRFPCTTAKRRPAQKVNTGTGWG